MVEISIRTDLPGKPLFLRVGNELEGIYEYGLEDRRIKWLPKWFPFNRYIDDSPEARVAVVAYLKRYGERLERSK